MIEIIPNFHPVVVHFPIVLTMVAFALALLSNLLKSHRLASYWSAASHLALWAAALSAVMAVIFGWLAYNSVNHDDAGHVAMGIHRVWAVSTAGLLILLVLWDIKKHLLTTIFPFYFVILLGVASASVGATAWLGGEVVFRHGIGVLSLPEEEDEGVAHDHEHEHESMKMDMPTVVPTKQTELSNKTESQVDARVTMGYKHIVGMTITSINMPVIQTSEAKPTFFLTKVSILNFIKEIS